MKIKYVVVSFVMLVFSACTNTTDSEKVHDFPKEHKIIDYKAVKDTIITAMEQSKDAWNRGDFEQYMDVYHKSDSMVFMGINSITYGWQQTLDVYKKGYPDEETRGTLNYDYISFKMLGNDHALVIGKFYLTRAKGNIDGNFSLIWKKINGEWKIIVDHT